MLILTNTKTKLSKQISLDNLSFNDFEKIVSFYVNLDNYIYKIIR